MQNETPGLTPNQQQALALLMHEHLQWLFKVHGPAGLSAVVGVALGMGASLNTNNGAPLPADVQRFVDACVAANRAYQAAASAGIIAAPASARVNGKRIV